MAKTVLLVRHGKARPATAGEPDAQRALTDPGRRSVAAWFPRIIPLLDMQAGCSIHVWASPAVRARQTAAEIVSACKSHGIAADADVRLVECLWTQDGDEFLRLLSRSSADMVVAVGHVPFVEDFCERLCGAHLPFDTGAVAALRIDDRLFDASDHPKSSAEETSAGSSAHLLWFMQGPAWQRWETLCEVESVLDAAAKRVDDRLAAFQANPADAEAAHRLRVSIRTTRSLLAFTAPFQKRRWNRRIRDDLRDIVVQTSYLRELDVLSEQAATLQPPADDLLQACGHMRAIEQNRVCKAFSGKKLRSKMVRVRKALRSVQWKDGVRNRGLSTEDMSTRFYRMARSSSMELDELDISDAQAAHAVRKDVKQTRYVAEGFARMLGPQAAHIAESMMRVQDDLGALCDARVNIAIVQRFPEAGLSDQALLDLVLLETRNKAFICTVLRAAGTFGGTEALGPDQPSEAFEENRQERS